MGVADLDLAGITQPCKMLRAAPRWMERRRSVWHSWRNPGPFSRQRRWYSNMSRRRVRNHSDGGCKLAVGRSRERTKNGFPRRWRTTINSHALDPAVQAITMTFPGATKSWAQYGEVKMSRYGVGEVGKRWPGWMRSVEVDEERWRVGSSATSEGREAKRL
jgi:hypothetical protein